MTDDARSPACSAAALQRSDTLGKELQGDGDKRIMVDIVTAMQLADKVISL